MSRSLPGKPIRSFLPDDWQERFSVHAAINPVLPEAGLYFSTYIDWHRLLSLPVQGAFQLLLWQTDRNGRIQSGKTRAYSGKAKLTRFKTGDRLINLDFADAAAPLGSDLWDAALYVVDDDGPTRLLRRHSIRDFATSIGWNSTLGKSERYFTRIASIDDVPDLRTDGVMAPPLSCLPQSIRNLIPEEPIQATIISVGEIPSISEPDPAFVVAVIDKGSEDGVRHNMPFASAPGSDRPLIGWCSAPSSHNCNVRIRVRRDPSGNVVALPVPGDVLVSRAPSA